MGREEKGINVDGKIGVEDSWVRIEDGKGCRNEDEYSSLRQE